MPGEDETTIDWSSATVAGARLTVTLRGPAPKAWRNQLADVIRRLEHGDRWGEIEIGKSQLKVAGVAPGTESDLRHFLESAILQADADLQPEADEDEDEDGDDDAGERSGPDEEMTAAFRAFSGSRDDDDG